MLVFELRELFQVLPLDLFEDALLESRINRRHAAALEARVLDAVKLRIPVFGTLRPVFRQMIFVLEIRFVRHVARESKLELLVDDQAADLAVLVVAVCTDRTDAVGTEGETFWLSVVDAAK